MHYLRDIAGQEINAGDILAFVRTGILGPGLKIGKILSVSGMAGKLIVWAIEDDFPAVSRPELSKVPCTIQSTNRLIVLDQVNIRRDYIELLAGVSRPPSFNGRNQRPRSTGKPSGRYLPLVPPTNPRRRNQAVSTKESGSSPKPKCVPIHRFEMVGPWRRRPMT